MGDEGEFWKDVRQDRREKRARLGIPCPECVAKLPKASPTILLPGQRCRIHGYRDPRKREDFPGVDIDAVHSRTDGDQHD